MSASPLSGDAEAARVRAILRSRARDLARVPAVQRPVESVDVLTFSIGAERFAVESRYVQGIFRVATLTLLPAAAAPLIGITEWQGDLLTLTDLRRTLGFGGHALTDRTLVVSIGARQSSLGVLVDAVIAHRSIPLADIAAVPAGAAATPQYLRGITSDAVVLVDALALLDPPRPLSTALAPKP